MSYFNDTRAELAIMPSVLIIGVDGYEHLLSVLQEHMDEPVKPKKIIQELMGALAQKDNALQELEYHCLGLLEENSMGHMYHWFEPMVKYIDHVGREIYRNLVLHGAYLNGHLPYELHRIRPSGIYFQRKDLFQQEVTKELSSHERQGLPFNSRLVGSYHIPAYLAGGAGDTYLADAGSGVGVSQPSEGVGPEHGGADHPDL